MNVLITGITGYIGSRLAKALLPECDVYGIFREPLNRTYFTPFPERVTLIPYDGTCQSLAEAVQRSRPDLVYHLAAYYTGSHGAEHTPKLVESNLTFGAYLLEALSGLEAPALVYASTIMAHYQGEAYRPLNLYAAAKKAFSDLIAYYTDAESLRSVTLVLSDTYGPGDRRPKVLNLIKTAVRNGEPLALTSGEQDYDAVYIDDVVRAFRLAGTQLLRNPGWKNETFQLCAPQPLTLRETVERLLSVNACTWRAAWGARPHPEREIRRAIRIFPPLPGWEPEVSLEEGLSRFWNEEPAGRQDEKGENSIHKKV